MITLEREFRSKDHMSTETVPNLLSETKVLENAVALLLWLIEIWYNHAIDEDPSTYCQGPLSSMPSQSPKQNSPAPERTTFVVLQHSCERNIVVIE